MFESSQEKGQVKDELLEALEMQLKASEIYLESIRITDSHEAKKVREEIAELKVEIDQRKKTLEEERLNSEKEANIETPVEQDEDSGSNTEKASQPQQPRINTIQREEPVPNNPEEEAAKQRRKSEKISAEHLKRIREGLNK